MAEAEGENLPRESGKQLGMELLKSGGDAARVASVGDCDVGPQDAEVLRQPFAVAQRLTGIR
jgi:hypothetical protein